MASSTPNSKSNDNGNNNPLVKPLAEKPIGGVDEQKCDHCHTRKQVFLGWKRAQVHLM